MTDDHREALRMAFSARESFQSQQLGSGSAETLGQVAERTIGRRLAALVAVWIGSHRVPDNQAETDRLQRYAMCDLVCQVWTLVENGEDQSPDQQATEEA